MNRIDAKFRDLRRNNKKAFIAYITSGYPDLNTTEKLAIKFAEIGVDVLELGIPFSDPLADGPIIQEASQQALKNGVHIKEVLDLVKRVRKSVDMPISLMTYYNPVFCFGEERFLRQAFDSGVDGIIIPDLPPEEARPLIKLANKYNLDVICFLSPTSSEKRIRFISKVSKGFIYYVALTGVTGARKDLAPDLIHKLKQIKSLTSKPVCVGFGVSTSGQIAKINRYADGVIVGSAIIKEIRDNIGKSNLARKVSALVRRLKG